MSESENIFSRIITGEVQAAKVYEDDATLAFLDHNPVTRGHSLVIPKVQVDHLDECDEKVYLQIFSTVHKVSKLLKSRLKPDRIALVVHGYEIPHAHIHVIPVYQEGDIKFPQRPERIYTSHELQDVLKDLEKGI